VTRRLSDGPSDSASAVFARASEGFLDTGGTSGPLFGMWFRELSKATAQSADAAALAAGVAAGVATVQRLGHALVGDKAMVDAMLPVAEAMTGRDLDADLAAAARAARTGAENTEQLRARRGHSSYVGDVAVGVLDPGAVTVALFFESARGRDLNRAAAALAITLRYVGEQPCAYPRRGRPATGSPAEP
jgi:dihydroxyacetone kinase-like protein